MSKVKGLMKSMNDMRNEQLYTRLKNIFKQMEPNKILVMAALTLERLWQPFVYGIEKTEYTAKEKEDFLQIEELRMDMIWERIKSGKVNPKHLSKFDETMEREYELTDVDRNVFGAELDGRAAYLSARIVGVAKSFFTVSKFDIGQCAQTVSNGLSVIMWEINNMLYIDVYEESYQIFKVNSKLTKYIKNNHPAVLEELQRVEKDMELAQRYPQSMEEILQKRMEYHELNICDNHLLECAFVRNALNEHIIREL